MAIIIFGKQMAMIKNQLKKIINEKFNNKDFNNVINFNAKNNTVLEIVDECEQQSLGFDDKIVVVEDAYFLSNARTKINESFKSDMKRMVNYLDSENPSCELIFVLPEEKINKKNEIYDIVLKKGRIIELKDVTKQEWPIYIAKYFEKRNISISKDAINELALRCNGDLSTFLNESAKLILYKGNNIKYEDIKKIVTKPLEENAFEILNNLLIENKNEALSTFRDLRINSVEPISLITMITTSLVFYDMVYLLKEKGLNSYSIASKLNANPYRVSITLKNLDNINYDRIKRAFDSLYLLDKQIKHGEVDRFYAFEMFILNF